jgi:hypothetical protein
MLFDGRDTDKNREPGHHGYGAAYEAILRGKDIRTILEIGVLSGQSLLAWGDYFPHARIIGVDSAASQPQFADPRITCHRGDATIWSDMEPIVRGHTFDLIVDDGSHHLCDQLTSWFLLWPFVALGGFYVIEDVADAGTLSHWRQIGFTVYDLRENAPADNVLCVMRKRAGLPGITLPPPVP